MPYSASSRPRPTSSVLRSRSPDWSSSRDRTSLMFVSSPPILFHHRSPSLPRVAVCSSRSATSIVSSSSARSRIDHPLSPKSSLAVSPRRHVLRISDDRRNSRKATCMCSPTSHPRSFRCGLHKDSSPRQSVPPSRSNVWSLAMKNLVVRIGVEGDLMRRVLTALICPSSRQQHRRMAFQPLPSRLSVMSKASDP
ncbi:hypothetical protein MLD38_013972 [Melastoma candidum]|uniref:Uncharacterized protein n=1 Tax=Melastoma candidum TaxID=119954 RepID=A0ACB9RAW7_9MYRT|nr:hypothetical protein MLD38_013972 [Melastoma candidum]